ncbi:hypothetical protein [Pseudomonas sp. MONT-RG-20F-20-E-7-02]|uniref:hypothetical protein n=1 Tax=Pseudomonas sp. MONT-RG-20F-20-E-7-02 TaxID=2914979 RepID=UPI001F57281C|nr:hypothetical protein [Pseudomonas sp. MONT-RG-20F-20-E-7-02]
MTTNQTIDGVPRQDIKAACELIEVLWESLQRHSSPQDNCYTIDEVVEKGHLPELAKLRALLDTPDECRCKRFGKGNPHWPCPVHAEPAAQPQGEPVERQPDAIIEGVMTSVGISHAIYASTVSLKHGEQVKLYAERPAPSGPQYCGKMNVPLGHGDYAKCGDDDPYGLSEKLQCASCRDGAPASTK